MNSEYNHFFGSILITPSRDVVTIVARYLYCRSDRLRGFKSTENEYFNVDVIPRTFEIYRITLRGQPILFFFLRIFLYSYIDMHSCSCTPYCPLSYVIVVVVVKFHIFIFFSNKVRERNCGKGTMQTI